MTAERVVNALADAYIVERLDEKFEATRNANVWLADRLNTLRQEVQVSEDAVEQYRNANGLLRAQTALLSSVALGAPAPQTNAPLCSRCRHPGHGVCTSGHLSSQPAPIS